MQSKFKLAMRVKAKLSINQPEPQSFALPAGVMFDCVAETSCCGGERREGVCGSYPGIRPSMAAIRTHYTDGHDNDARLTSRTLQGRDTSVARR